METLKIEARGPVTRIHLSRPEVRNAFNETLIVELTQAFTSLPSGTRVAVLMGEGPVFCAGADIGWMKRSREYTEAQNAQDAASMAAMLRAIDECPAPVIACVAGAALGGGSGLVAACDIAIAAEGTQFGFTEARLGLIPAVISTFVLPKVGMRGARRYFLTGERFGAPVALALGLVHEVVVPETLEARVGEIAAEILQCGPAAVASAKLLLREVAAMPRGEAIEHTIRRIAQIRVSPEAQEGLGAFLEKRRPGWA
jgi:methylglutaconyl-CoA hydratase